MMLSHGPIRQENKVYKIALVSILAALCIASRMVLSFIPNVKPVTSIVIIVSVIYGRGFGMELAFVVTVVSNLLMGMGPWTVFQVLAWMVIALISGSLGKLKIGYNPWFMAVFAFLSGYLFGFLVSFEKLLYGGWGVFWAYYASGFVFDTLHAFGNLIFYPLCWFPLSKILKNR